MKKLNFREARGGSMKKMNFSEAGGVNSSLTPYSLNSLSCKGPLYCLRTGIGDFAPESVDRWTRGPVDRKDYS